MRPGSYLPFLSIFLSFALPAFATSSNNGEIFPSSTWTISPTVPVEGASAEPRAQRMWHLRFDQPVPSPVPVKLEVAPQDAAAQPRPQAFEYSDFYNTRRKIHMIASYLTLPLFVGEYVAGEKLYDGEGSEAAKSAHGAFTAGLAGLFGVNTVTGVWNLWEGRHDPNGRTRRVVHSVLMLAADAGFVATASLAPDDDHGSVTTDRSAHRNMAITSMGLAAASYIYMLVTR